MARVLVVYASLFGANAQLAELVEGALVAAGAQVRVRRVPEIALPGAVRPPAERDEVATGDDLAWADGFVFSSPAHTGSLSASMKAFVNQHHNAAVEGEYLNKTFTALATSGFAHAERVIDQLNDIGAVWGCLLVPPSTANPAVNRLDGNPFGLSFVLAHGKLPDIEIAAEVLAAHLGRFVAVTDAVAGLRPPPPKAPPPTAADVFG